MTAADVYATLLNRGLTPSIGPGGRLDFGVDRSLFGEKGPLTPALERVVAIHETELKRLVAARWLPEVKAAGPRQAERTAAVARERQRPMPRTVETPPAARDFDHDAEQAVRELYGIDYGVRWSEGKFRLFPAVRTYPFDCWWGRYRPLWPRILTHLSPPDGHDGFMEFRRERIASYPAGEQDPVVTLHLSRRKMWSAGRFDLFPAKAGHWFEAKPAPGCDAWRWPGESEWRMLWGRWVQEYRWNPEHWVPWGTR